MRAEAGVTPASRDRGFYEERRRQKERARRWRRRVAVCAVAVLAVGALGIGFAFAGSSDQIAGGITIGGVDVGGMTPAEARRTLEQRAAAVAAEPVSFTYEEQAFAVEPDQLGVTTDWDAAIEKAVEKGDGFALFRGFSRLKLSLSGADVAPVASADPAEVAREVRLLAEAIDQAPREAAIVLNGLSPSIEPAQVGIELDQEAAASLLVDALARVEHDGPVALPVSTSEPKVTRADLEPVAARVETVLSAPVLLQAGERTLTVKPKQLASFLVLPSGGSTDLGLGGPAVERYFARVASAVNQDPRDADFKLTAAGKVRVVPALEGRRLNVAASQKTLLAAALAAAPGRRTAELPLKTAQPKLTTEKAKAMGITGIVGSYTTVFGGVANRIHNVQLVSRLLDDHLIGPGETFSFNETTGERNAAKGFLEAPVIINGELETGLGGGVCQVSTTVFNAAYEAGLPIRERTNHALYISHYPLARDATVNYPDTDLKFTNDTGQWLWLRTFVDSSSLTVNLYGSPVHREVVSETSPLVVTGAPRVKKVRDPNLFKGEKVVEEAGTPSRATSVRRIVYDENGDVLYDTTWYSSYRGEPRVVRIGTKPKPKTKPAEDGPAAGGGSQAGGEQGGETGGGSQTPPPSEPPAGGGSGSGEPPPPPA